MEEILPVVWFTAIGVLWIGFVILEGFDLGVGMRMLLNGKSENDRRVMLNTIGPVWDGNEVWLITAGAAIFAAFPLWYAALFSALYVPLTIALFGLILRAVGIEYRGKVVSGRWTKLWTWCIGLGSIITAFCVGAALALTSLGLPIDSNGDRVGGPFVWLTPVAILGGVALVCFSYAHGATFLALKTDGPVRERSARFAQTWAPVFMLPAAGWALWVQFAHGGGTVFSWIAIALAVVCLITGWFSARSGREGRAFTGYAGFGVFGVGAIFMGMFPNVLPSTIDPTNSLTVWNASSSDYTLGVMTIVALIGLPIVLAYQAWSYWVFRRRISPGMIPSAHSVIPAVLRPSS